MTTEQLIEQLKKVPIWHNVWWGYNLCFHVYMLYEDGKLYHAWDGEEKKRYSPTAFQSITHWQKVTTAGYKNFEVKNV
jgi:hypothetical protein